MLLISVVGSTSNVWGILAVCLLALVGSGHPYLGVVTLRTYNFETGEIEMTVEAGQTSY